MKENSRQWISTGSPYEPKIGISRAVRTGNMIAISGTAPLGPDGKTVAIGDPSGQARRCFEIIRTAIEDWETVALVHGEFFKDIRPASTMVQVVRFIDPDWLVEIEADAVIGTR